MPPVDLESLSLQAKEKAVLPEEIWHEIFSYHQLPSAATIGRERWEVINVPKDARQDCQSGMSINENRFGGACTHRHDEWKAQLHTLSAVSKTNRELRRIVLPLLYRVYPGQSLVDPKLFIRTIKSQPLTAALVLEAVIDPWDSYNRPKDLKAQVETLELGYPLVMFLHKAAKKRNGEAHAALLLVYCSNVKILDLTCPSFSQDEGAVFTIFKQLRMRGPNTMAKNNEQFAQWKNTLTEIPLRKMTELHLHHAEHHYVRDMRNLGALVLLPTVQSVTAYRFYDHSGALDGLRHITELDLWRCSFDAGPLLAALRSCTGLISLSITFAGFTSMWGRLIPKSEHLPDFRQLGDTIRTTHKKLRKLRIDDRELQPPEARTLGSFRDLTDLEELAVNESCLGSYEVKPDIPLQLFDLANAYAATEESELADLLPASLKSLTIFRTDEWWLEARSGLGKNEYSGEGGWGTYRFDRIHDKVYVLLGDGIAKLHNLKSIHMDTFKDFGRDLRRFGWKWGHVSGDPKMAKPSIVADSMMPAEEKRTLERRNHVRVSEPSLLLTRASSK